MSRPLHRPTMVAAAAALLVSVTAAGCNTFGGDDGDDTGTAVETVVAPDISVTIPPSRLTPFCQAMIDLSDELQDDPPADEGARIIEVYQGIVDDVPAEIRDDFLVVLARLQAGTPAVTAAPATTIPGTTVPGTTLVDADEGYFPDDDPALRLNAYISSNCRSTQNNPGPLATQPGEVTADDE